MLGSYGGAEFETPNLDRFAQDKAVRFTRHVTGSLPCMPARHDILCGALDFLWRPWGSIELWEEPITAAPAGRGRHDDAGVGPPAPVRDRRRELPHRLHRLGLRAGPRGRPVADRARPDLGRRPGPSRRRGRLVLAAARRRPRRRAGLRPGPHLLPGRGGLPRPAGRCAAASEWLRQATPHHDRWFLFVDEFDPHEPFDTPEPWVGRYDPDWDDELIIWPPVRRRRGGVGPVERAARPATSGPTTGRSCR